MCISVSIISRKINPLMLIAGTFLYLLIISSIVLDGLTKYAKDRHVIYFHQRRIQVLMLLAMCFLTIDHLFFVRCMLRKSNWIISLIGFILMASITAITAALVNNLRR